MRPIMRPQETLDALREFPKLRRLEIRGKCMDPNFQCPYPDFICLVADTYKDDHFADVAFPLLSTLVFGSASGIGPNLRAFMEKKLDCAQKWKALEDGVDKDGCRVVPIAKLEMWECSDVSNEDLAAIERLIEDGRSI